jgi:hypothetical protein
MTPRWRRRCDLGGGSGDRSGSGHGNAVPLQGLAARRAPCDAVPLVCWDWDALKRAPTKTCGGRACDVMPPQRLAASGGIGRAEARPYKPLQGVGCGIRLRHAVAAG